MSDNFRSFQVAPVSWDVLYEKIGPESVDLAIIDFPSKSPHAGTGAQSRQQDWYPVLPREDYPKIIEGTFNVLKKSTHAYFFVPQKKGWQDFICDSCETAGFSVSNVLTWDKVHLGNGYSWRDTTMQIVFCRKGRRSLESNSPGEIIRAPRVSGNKAFPGEKPTLLYEKLIRNSSKPGDIVCDPMIGSGACGEAALLNFRRIVGGDSWKRAHKHTVARLSDVATRIYQYTKDYIA